MPGLVFDIQKFSLQDGPGIRTTIFMKGCPMTCPWCSNPEGIAPTPQIMTFDRKCIGCKKCVDTCPVDAVRFAHNSDNEQRTIDFTACDQCLECAHTCPSGAIQVSGVRKTVDEAFAVAARDKNYYATSKGGVTVSGGEPLLQWKFVSDLFRKCKRAGFHTALDTSGHAPWEHMEQVLEHTDLVLFDLKHTDPDLHRGKTGLSNELILENLERAAARTAIWLRIPLTPGFNDSESNMNKTAELARKINAEKISLLPFHDWGREKYARLGKTYLFTHAQSLAADGETVARCRAILESHGLVVRVGA